MKQIPGVRVTLISEDYDSAYSGMLPGCVASTYTKDQISIQLSALCSSANVRFICAEVTGLDPDSKKISLRGRSPVRYDTLSINAGGSPGMNRSIGINVKPINLFLPRWQAAAAEIGTQKSYGFGFAITFVIAHTHNPRKDSLGSVLRERDS